MSTIQFDEVMVAFAKTIFESFDEIIDEINYEIGWSAFTDELTHIGYDGTFQSILYNEFFWNELVIVFIQFRKIYQKMICYNTETNNVLIKSFIKLMPHLYCYNKLHIMNRSYDYFQLMWSEKYRDETRNLVESEFGICPK